MLIDYLIIIIFLVLQNGSRYKSTIDGLGKDLQFVKIPPHRQTNSTLKRIHITSINNGETIQSATEQKPILPPKCNAEKIENNVIISLIFI